MTNHDSTIRDAAIKILKRGLASPSEVAELAGVNRQLVRYWSIGVDWRKARKTQLTKVWLARMQG